MSEKKKILIFYDWFYPGFRAGGPIQSLTNLCSLINPLFDVSVITSAFDLNCSQPYNSVKINSWNRIRLPASEDEIEVYYGEKIHLTKKIISDLIVERNPSIVYLNGIFSYRFFILPLLFLNKKMRTVKVVLCPRGMLTKGALSGKASKKKIYIKALRLSGALNNITWHATSAEEAREIKALFTVEEKLVIAPNIPKKPLFNIPAIYKVPGELRLVYLSLINQHKNLLLLLQLVQTIEANITLDIFGPVIDDDYWKQCEALIQQMPLKVKYKGTLEPANVQTVIAKYHVFILFTKGENFGHALYESLSVGRPVVTTHFTPWQNLYNKKAGINVHYSNFDECKKSLNQFIDMPADEYDSFCVGAHKLAKDYFEKLQAEMAYLKLFS